MIAAAELYSVVDKTLRIKLHRGQTKAWRSNRRFVFAIAGTQGGKTSFVPYWLDREIERGGHGDYLAATATYDLFKLKFLPVMRGYFVDMLGWHEDKSDRVFWRAYKPRMFDRIILRSASSEGGLESATIKAAVLDECGQDEFRITAWEAVQRRLSLSQGRVLGTTTPYNMGWLKTEIYDRWRKKDQDYEVVQFKSIENPTFPRAEYNRAKATLPTWKFSMFYDGQFTRPAGMIYEDYDEAVHKIAPIHIPPEWPRYVGLDFGPVHTALVWIAENPFTHVFYLYRESLDGGKTTHQHASGAIKSAEGENIVRWTGGAPSEDQYRMDWGDEGITIGRPKIIEVDLGIDRVIELLKTKRLFIFDTCKKVLDEMGIYARKLDLFGQPTEEIANKNTFHMLDALRYDVIGIMHGGSIEVVKDPFAGW